MKPVGKSPLPLVHRHHQHHHHRRLNSKVPLSLLTSPNPHINEPTTKTHFPYSAFSTSSSSLLLSKHRHHLNNEPSTTNNPLLSASLHKPKPTSTTATTTLFSDQMFSHSFTPMRLLESTRFKERIFGVHLLRQPKLSFKTTFHDPKPGNFIQRRVFSSESQNGVPIDAGSSMRKPISLWPGMYHSPVSNALWEARSSIFEKTNDQGSSQIENELVAKPPSKSRTSILYKFSSDYILREQYRNPWNEIRTGKLVEDLDALAGTISFKHCCNDDGTTRPLLLVTASVDKMVLKKPIRVDADLTIVGAVTWVGRSSMEIQLEVTQPTEGTTNPSESVALVANFTFVARDSKTGKSAPVNQISPETEQEKLLWEEAEERNKMRKKKRAESKRGPENGDAERLNALLAEGRVFCDMPALADRDSILIKDTLHENSFICQPQQRNIHGRIFGGFLMRKAFELAFSNAYAFAGVAPRFVEVDHIDFLKPVDVGNFLRLKSCVLYTELENPAQPLINLEVVAHVTRPELRSSEVSNKFYFTFTVLPKAIKDGLRIRNVVPATEEEARRVLERMDAESSQMAK